MMIADVPPAIQAQVVPAPVAPAPAPNFPILPGPDGTPNYLVGVHAYGSPGDVARLESAVALRGWPSQRENLGDGRVKLMIAFPGASAEEVRAFLDQAARGEFGTFAFESAMAPVADDGRRD